MIPCPEPITHPMTGNWPRVCCHLGGAGRNALSCGKNSTSLAFLMRSVVLPDRPFDKPVVCPNEPVCASTGATAAVDVRPTASFSLSQGKAPLARIIGSGAMRGGMDVGTDAVAVADDSVAEDCDAPICIVVDDIVFGDVAADEPPIVRIALSPPVGTVPLYGSANTV